MRIGVRVLSVVALLSIVAVLSGCDLYVALGDSYTSGPAILPQDPAIPGCLRSQVNYPHLVARDLHQLSLVDVSCSGAQTKDMTSSQDVNPDPDPARQFDALGANAKVVTLGIGGNDLGFVDTAEPCVRLATQPPLAPPPCKDYYVANGVTPSRPPPLQTRLDGVLDGIAARAPAA